MNSNTATEGVETVDEQILQCLSTSGAKIEIALEKELALTPEEIYNRCESLIQCGLIENPLWCLYRVTPEGKEFLKNTA
jgi:predicted transcriptional regulator